MWTHLPVLAWCIARTTGLIVEFGAGDFSTPFLHFFAEHGRDVVTYEETSHWLNKFRYLFSGRHQGLVLPQASAGQAAAADVVLIDGSAESRGPILALLAECPVRYIVVHDTQPATIGTHPGLRQALERYTYRYDWTTLQPQTTIVSNIGEIDL
jgi:hypothetical protein